MNPASELRDTFEAVIGVLKPASAVEINEKPPTGGWSAGQIAEHIVLCSNGIPDSDTADAGRPFDEKVPVFEQFFADDSLKMEADESLHPRENQYDPDELIGQLRNIQQKLVHIANTRDLERLCLDMELPQLGHMTRYEWLHFIVHHTRRHTRQMQRTLGQIAGAQKMTPPDP